MPKVNVLKTHNFMSIAITLLKINELTECRNRKLFSDYWMKWYWMIRKENVKKNNKKIKYSEITL